MDVPPGLNRRAIGRLLLAVPVVLFAAAGTANAADPPDPGPLDRPISDLALIDVGGPAAPPMLLTIDTADLPSGTVRASLLDQSADWRPAASVVISIPEPLDGMEMPWLVELGPDRFAVLVTSHRGDRTAIVPIRVDPRGAVPLQIGQATTIPAAVDDAGAIDVDADGVRELIVATATTGRRGDVCQGSTVRVLDGTTLSTRGEWPVPDVRLAGGVLGDWDGRPGGDLLAYVHDNCPAGPDSVQGMGLAGIRLADGSPIPVPSLRDPDGPAISPGVPLAADLDGDGRPEAVVRDGASLVLLEPARGWARTEVAEGDVTPLVAAGPEASGRPGTLLWLADAGAASLTMSLGSVTRSPDGSLGVAAEHLDLAAVSRARRTLVLRSMGDVALAQAASQAWRGDIDGDGCAEILAPLLTTRCTGSATTLNIGATWFATRPIAAFETGESRELLIAATMDWDPARGAPLPASPAAVLSPGAWRHGPSPRFALAVVRAADAAYFSTFPVPRPTIERAAVRGQATDIPGFTGARVFLQAVGNLPDDPPPAEAPDAAAFLSDPPPSGALVTLARIPVPPGAESGRDGSFVHVSLAHVQARGDGPTGRWTVTIVQVNDWGEVAGSVRGTIVRETAGPSLTIEVPFVSAPWPLEATIQGRSEPGVQVLGGSAGAVVADRRGRFALPVRLAPWPQTLELTATDSSGITTTKRFSVVGGIDYRAFPWPAIAAVILLLAAALSTGRGTKVGRRVEQVAGVEALYEMEDLPSGGDWPPPAERSRRA